MQPHWQTILGVSGGNHCEHCPSVCPARGSHAAGDGFHTKFLLCLVQCCELSLLTGLALLWRSPKTHRRGFAHHPPAAQLYFMLLPIPGSGCQAGAAHAVGSSWLSPASRLIPAGSSRSVPAAVGQPAPHRHLPPLPSP